MAGVTTKGNTDDGCEPLPIPTLKHLKRLHERMRMGRRPMLGILLLGHPELEDKLNRFDVREVSQPTTKFARGVVPAHNNLCEG